MVAFWFDQVTYVCEGCNNLQDSNSVFMITDFNIFPINNFGTAKFWWIVGLTALLRLFQRKNSPFLSAVFIAA